MNRKMRVLIAILMVAAAPFSASAQENQVTVTHELGEVSARNPQTVVVFDYGLLDIVDSLGVEVVGVVKATLPEYLSKFKDDAYVDVGTLFEPNFERIYELQPDVILVSGRQAEVYEELNRIAPTVYLTIDPQDYWASFSSNVRILGDIFGRTDFAEAELASLQASMEEIADQAGQLRAKALILMVNDGALSVYGPGSRFGVVHKEFGFPPADEGIEVVNHGQSVSLSTWSREPRFIAVIDRLLQ